MLGNSVPSGLHPLFFCASIVADLAHDRAHDTYLPSIKLYRRRAAARRGLTRVLVGNLTSSSRAAGLSLLAVQSADDGLHLVAPAAASSQHTDGHDA